MSDKNYPLNLDVLADDMSTAEKDEIWSIIERKIDEPGFGQEFHRRKNSFPSKFNTQVVPVAAGLVGVVLVAIAIPFLIHGAKHAVATQQKNPVQANTQSWVPTVTDIQELTLNLNVGVEAPYVQTQGPISIYPTSESAKALLGKVIGWLQSAKQIPMEPIAGGEFGEHTMTFQLKNGKTLEISEDAQVNQDGTYSISQSKIVISNASTPSKETIYESPALAQWLDTGWKADTQEISAGWTYKSQQPPNGHPNQISGSFKDGEKWVFAGDSARDSVTFYMQNGGAWLSFPVKVNNSLLQGASVEQAQFVDSQHGFVLIGGTPSAGQLPCVLYATSDGGANWHQLANKTLFTPTNADVQMRFDSQRDGWLTWLSKKYNPPRIYVYHTTDGGKTWSSNYFNMPNGFKNYSGFNIATAPVYYKSYGGWTIRVLGQSTAVESFDMKKGSSHWVYDKLGNG